MDSSEQYPNVGSIKLTDSGYSHKISLIRTLFRSLQKTTGLMKTGTYSRDVSTGGKSKRTPMELIDLIKVNALLYKTNIFVKHVYIIRFSI